MTVLALALLACGSQPGSDSDQNGTNNSSAVPVTTDERRTVMFLGTSLTAGYGLSPDEAYPARIQARIDSLNLPFRVVNAGVSGETSAGALRRIDWLAQQGPLAVLVVETGANDGLRGQSVDSLRSNLRQVLTRAAALEPRPALIVAGMESPPNMGRQYAARFREVFPEVADEFRIAYLPFLLDGVAGTERLNQRDGIHPTAEGARRVAENVWRTLAPILDSIARTSGEP
jgi:acyl-CoA thioesterase-1